MMIETFSMVSLIFRSCLRCSQRFGDPGDLGGGLRRSFGEKLVLSLIDTPDVFPRIRTVGPVPLVRTLPA